MDFFGGGCFRAELGFMGVKNKDNLKVAVCVAQAYNRSAEPRTPQPFTQQPFAGLPVLKCGNSHLQKG